MKRNLGKICVLMAALTCILWGCGKTPVSPSPQRRVVTQVDVTCVGDEQQLRRHYTDPVKMEKILNYLRLAKACNPTSRIPQPVPGSYHITLTFSDGSYASYHQKGTHLLLKEDGTWQKIDPENALRLGSLLDSMPSDGPM